MKENVSWKPTLLPVGLCIKDGMIWFIQGCGNQLIGMDIHSFQIRKRLTIPCFPWGESFFHRELNDKIIDIGNRLLILLNGSDIIYAYDFSSGGIDKVTCLPNRRTFLNNAVVYKEGILFLLPYHSNCLLKYDVCRECWEEVQVANYDICMEQPFEIENDLIWAVDSHSNIVCQYYFYENRMEEIRVGDKSNHYWGLIKTNGYYVLPHSDKKVVTLWKQETGEIYEIIDFPKEFQGVEGYYYLAMYRTGKDVLLIPYYRNLILKIDVINKRISNIFSQNIFCSGDSSCDKMNNLKAAYYASIIQNKKMYLYSVTQRNWHVVDIDSMNVKELPECEISREHKQDIGRLFDDIGKKYFLGYESEYSCCNLDNFMLSIKDCTKIGKEADTCNGMEIWKEVV